jgi:hypothetical protein
LNIASGEVVNCIFTENFGRNGPIFTVKGSTEDIAIINSLFYNNTSSLYGGGLIVSGSGRIDVTNCTFADNSAIYGSAIWVDQGAWLPAGNTHITNTIVWGSMEGIGDSVNGYYTVPTVSYSNLESLTAAWGDTTDAGLDSAVTTAVDLAGNPRIQGANVDHGAYEYVIP